MGVIEFNELKRKLPDLRKGKKVVLCHGVFDLLHIGHIRYLKRAKELGDILIVTVTPDQWVDKGPHRPAFSGNIRCEALSVIEAVDFVALNLWPTAQETLLALKPDIYAKGGEFKNLEDPTGKIALEEAICRKSGIDIVFIDELTFSSSNLINRYLSTLSTESQEYLEQFRMRHTVEDVLGYLELFKDMHVIVAGDIILDEYTYCSPLGASSKDPVLALKYNTHEKFAGGSIAICNHLSTFVKKVTLCSSIGDDGEEQFIKNNILDNVELDLVIRKKVQTLRKHRIIDSSTFQKHLEIYSMDEPIYSDEYNCAMSEKIEKQTKNADLLLVADFGNGCISNIMAENISELPIFKAVNTQSNAGNRGQHTIGKYEKAEFISLAKHEILLEFRNKSMEIIDMMIALKDAMRAKYLVVTEGREGCAVLDNDDFQRAPSFSTSIVDRVGAGDAVFAITALAARTGLPAEVIAFLANIAGSLAIQYLGNAKPLSKRAASNYIRSIMK